jgi:uncharacterized membrane protein YdjX (TVP38/TMEM64 family)
MTTPGATLAPTPGTFRRLGAAGPVAIVLSFWPPLGGFVLLATLTTFAPWLREHVALGLLVYFFLTVLLVGFSFLPTFACAIFAGWSFGFPLGCTIAMIALTVASLVAYALGRWIARDRVLEVLADKPRARAVHRALLGQNSRRSLLVITLLRIPPYAPFAIVNFALAAARVPLWDYALGTFLGLIPRTAAAAFAAAGLAQLRFQNVTDQWTLVAGIVATVVVCLVLGALANRALRSLSAPGTRD